MTLARYLTQALTALRRAYKPLVFPIRSAASSGCSQLAVCTHTYQINHIHTTDLVTNHTTDLVSTGKEVLYKLLANGAKFNLVLLID